MGCSLVNCPQNLKIEGSDKYLSICLTPQFLGFGGNWPINVKAFENYVRYFLEGTWIHVSWPNLTKYCLVCWRNPRLRGRRPSPHMNPLSWSHPKFPECYHPLTSEHVANLFQVGYSLPNLFRKDNKRLIFFVHTKSLQLSLSPCGFQYTTNTAVKQWSVRSLHVVWLKKCGQQKLFLSNNLIFYWEKAA